MEIQFALVRLFTEQIVARTGSRFGLTSFVMRLVSPVGRQVRLDVNRRHCLAENAIRRVACVSLVALLAADAAVLRFHVDVILSPERYVIFNRTVVPAPQIRTNSLRMSTYTAKFANHIVIPGACITTAYKIARPFTAIQTN